MGNGERVGVGIDTKANTLRRGAPQVGDLRLLENDGERGGALVSDVVVEETADEGRSGDGERVGVSMGTGTKCEHTGGGALQIGDLRLLEDGGERSGALSSDSVASETVSEGQVGKR